jgi:serpin B
MGPINAWCAEKTRGMIREVLSQEPSPVGAVLINALYFKGEWTKRFDAALTTTMPFNQLNGLQVQCQMMRAASPGSDGKFAYVETNICQILSLPYGDCGQYSAVLILPRKDSSATLTLPGLVAPTKAASGAAAQPQTSTLRDVLSEVVTGWRDIRGKLTQVKGSVRLPKFKLEYQVMLRDVLCKRGMGVAFTDPRQGGGADFSGMSPGGNLWVDSVIHKTVVEVDEVGTEAAAVTASGMFGCAQPPPEPTFQMTCDHPFLFIICHNRSSAITFAGAITGV